MPGGLWGQPLLGQHAHVQRGHAHEHGGARHGGDGRSGIELGQPDHLAAIQQRGVDGHEQAMHMEDGQGVDEHVPRHPAPVVLEHHRVGQQIAVRQHRPLAAPGGAAGVEDGGQVVSAPGDWDMVVAKVRGPLQQAARAVVAQREHMLRTGGKRDF